MSRSQTKIWLCGWKTLTLKQEVNDLGAMDGEGLE